MKYVYAYFAVIIKDWIAIMSGTAGLLLTVLGFYLSAKWQPRVFLVVGVLCLLYVSYRAWLAERRQREDLLQRLTPKLEFVHIRDVKPYHEEVTQQHGAKIRGLRVGLRNTGGQEIQKARLVLEGCNPGSSHTVRLEHELQPMGHPRGALTFSIPPHGLVFVEVAHEDVPPGQIYGTFRLCYAQGGENWLPDIGTEQRYTLILRAEGAGPAVRCSIDLGGRLSWRMDALTPLPNSETPVPASKRTASPAKR